MPLRYEKGSRVDMSGVLRKGGSTSFGKQGTSRIGMKWDIREVLQRLTRDVPFATTLGIAVGCERASHRLLRISEKYVPRDTEELAKSGRVISETGMGTGRFFTAGIADSKVTDNSYTAGIQYGNSDTPYALFVHEDEEALHGAAYNAAYSPKFYTNAAFHAKGPLEQAKWMDKAFEEGESEVHAEIMSSISIAIRRVLKAPSRYGVSGSTLSALREVSHNWKAELGW